MNRAYTAYAARKDFPYLAVVAPIVGLIALTTTFLVGNKTLKVDLNGDKQTDEITLRFDGSHSVKLRNEQGILMSREDFLNAEYLPGMEAPRKEEEDTIDNNVREALSELEKQ